MARDRTRGDDVMDMPFLTREQVESLGASLDVEAAVSRILRDAAEGLAGQAVRRELVPPNMPGLLGLMPAYRARAPKLFSAKVVCVMPKNPQRGLPAHQGICALFDGEDGHLIGLAEAGAVTELRTAALTAVATRTLAREGARRHLVIGSGHQTLPHLRAFARRDGKQTLALWARNRAAAEILRNVAAEQGVEVEVEDQLEAAVRKADIVTTLTGASEPILSAGWLQAGAHVNAMGSSTPFVREFGEDLIGRASIFVDDRDSALSLAGEFVRCEPRPEVREIGAVLAGKAAGRRNDTEITLFKSVGIGIQDLALLELLFAAAATPPDRA